MLDNTLNTSVYNVCAGKAKKVVVFENFDSDKKGETSCIGKGDEPGQH